MAVVQHNDVIKFLTHINTHTRARTHTHTHTYILARRHTERQMNTHTSPVNRPVFFAPCSFLVSPPSGPPEPAERAPGVRTRGGPLELSKHPERGSGQVPRPLCLRRLFRLRNKCGTVRARAVCLTGSHKGLQSGPSQSRYL